MNKVLFTETYYGIARGIPNWLNLSGLGGIIPKNLFK